MFIADQLQCDNNKLTPFLKIMPALAKKIQSINDLIENDNLEEAISQCDLILEESPEKAQIHNLKGMALRKKGELAAAKDCFETSLQIAPSDVDARFGLANILRTSGAMSEAEDAYKKVVELDPKHHKAYFNLGLIYQMSGQLKKALAFYEHALNINPSYSEALNNKGNVLKTLGDVEGAYVCYSKAVTIKPFAPTYYNIGLALQLLNKHDEAIEAYYCAVRNNPNYADAWSNLGLALHKVGRYYNAIDAYKNALGLKPENASIWNSLGNSYKKLNKLENAIECFRRVVTIKPDYSEAWGMLVQNKMHACDWDKLDEIFLEVEQAITRGGALVPFNILATPLPPLIQRRCAEQYTATYFPQVSPLTGPDTRYKHHKIRIGYFSADLHNHATAFLMADLFEHHDRKAFEIIAFSFGSEQHDEMATRVRKAFDEFYDVGRMTDAEIARLAVEKEIDIAVDLKGYTRGARPAIFTYMPAPIQVSYLGYPGTMGAPYIQYLIADNILIPDKERTNFTEKIAYMPDTYQVNARRKVLAQDAMARSDHGLPEDAFVFCCFNNNYKITPDVFDIWMKLLHELEHAVLWLFEANPSATINLRRNAAMLGISPDRLIFAKKVSQEKHLSRYYYADLVLDTFHYNAHTTTSDALWVGCPVITCLGKTFPGRVAGSILQAFGMPELITTSPDAYLNLAKELALDANRLKAIRQKVIAQKHTQPLFDIEQYTNNIERLYQQMYQRHQDSLPPEHLEISN